MKKIGLFLALALCFLTTTAQKLRDTVHLNEVIVISSFRPTEKTPVTEKLITREDISSASFGQELPVFLNNTPSVTSYADGGHFCGYTYMRLRGVDQTRINFTLNGVQMSEPEDMGFYSSNFPDFLASMKSVQIQRGVGTTTNGVCSYVGSINFESVNLRDSAYSNIVGSFGSFKSFRTSVEVNTGLKKNFGFYNRTSITGSDGYRYHSGGRGYSSFFSGGYFGGKDILKLNCFVGNSTNEMAWIGTSEKEIDSLGNRFNPNSSNEKDNFTQAFAQLQYTRLLGQNSSLTTTAYYNHLEGNWDLDLIHTFGDPNGFVINYQLVSNFVGLMSNYRYSKDKLRFNAGINGNYYERNHAMADKAFVDNLYYSNKGIKKSFSVFAKAEYDVKKITFFIDAQYSLTQFSYKKDKIDPTSAGMNSIIWNFFNPKIGASYNFNEKSKIYISIGRTYREPTRTDMFGGNDNLFYTDSVNTSFKKIKPESVTDFEAGFKFNSERLYLQANLFYMDLKNEITLLGAVGSYSLPLMTSVDNSYRSGIELDVSYKLGGVTFGNSSSYMYCRIKTDSGTFVPAMTPSFIFNQSVSYQIKGLCFGASYSYVTDRYINLANTFTLQASGDLNAFVKYAYKKAELTVGINNIYAGDKIGELGYDNGYVDATTGVPRFFVGAPRNYYATLRIGF